VWRDLVVIFQDVPAQQTWVRLAQQQLDNPDAHLPPAERRWAPVRDALQRARELRDQGKPQEAEAIWRALEELYRDDQSAADILEELRRDRGH
jgi:hypothetical protein